MRRKRVTNGVRYRTKRADGARLADALATKWCVRARRFAVLDLDSGTSVANGNK